MRGGIPIVVFLISFFITVFLFFVCSYIIGEVSAPLQNAANQTLPDPFKGQYNYFMSTVQRVLGIFCVIFMIGIIVAYALDSHREEGEEFAYYNRYNY